VRRLRRDVRVAEGGDRPRADAHRQLDADALLALAAASSRGLLSSIPQRRLLPLAVAREALPDRISIAGIDAIMELAE
jgi:hypothetical protein